MSLESGPLKADHLSHHRWTGGWARPDFGLIFHDLKEGHLLSSQKYVPLAGSGRGVKWLCLLINKQAFSPDRMSQGRAGRWRRGLPPSHFVSSQKPTTDH